MKRNTKIVVACVVAVLAVAMAYPLMQPVYEESALYDWRIIIYPTSGLDVGDDIQVEGESLIYAGPDPPFNLAAVSLQENLVWNRVMYQNRYVMMVEGSDSMNSTGAMEHWRWSIRFNNGTINHTHTENNLWYRSIYMDQHMNKNMWQVVSDGSAWEHSFSYSYNGYTVEVQLMEV